MTALRSVLFSTLLLAANASAADYRAANAAELAQLAPKLSPGDVVTLADGEWRDQAVAFRAHGTEEKPITLRAATPGKVVLVGKSTLVIDGDWLVVSGVVARNGDGPAEGIAIKGTHNRLTESAMIGGTYKHFLRMWGTDSRVDHCYFDGKTSGEPTFQVEVAEATPNRHRIDHNHFGPRPPLGRNGGETMRIGYSGQSMWNSRTLVEQNLFDRCDGEIEIISSKSCENIYRANTFLDCDGMLTLRHGNRCLIDGNFFLGHHKKGSGGIRVIGEDHVIVNNYFEGLTKGAFWITSGVPHSQLVQYFQARRCTIAFNTVVDSTGNPYLELDAGINSSGRLMRPAEITIANNLFVVPPQGTLLKGTEGEYWRWMGNLVSGATPEHAGLKVADPKLARGTDGLLRPAADSPARGAAEGIFPNVKTDIDGQPRTGKLDVGCDQISDAPIANHPLTAAEVGPAWLKR
jgi:poly(beta-D-mannuronate) lyase